MKRYITLLLLAATSSYGFTVGENTVSLGTAYSNGGESTVIATTDGTLALSRGLVGLDGLLGLEYSRTNTLNAYEVTGGVRVFLPLGNVRPFADLLLTTGRFSGRTGAPSFSDTNWVIRGGAEMDINNFSLLGMVTCYSFDSNAEYQYTFVGTYWLSESWGLSGGFTYSDNVERRYSLGVLRKF